MKTLLQLLFGKKKQTKKSLKFEVTKKGYLKRIN